MKIRIQVLLLLSLAIYSQQTNAQDIKTYTFDELEPIFHQQNDTTYLINFWAMWCKPCVEELPEFEDIRKDYADKKVKVILISLDFGSTVQERMTKFLERKDIHAEVRILDDPDANSWIGKVDEEWDGALPATVIYKKNKKTVFTRQVSYEELAKSINNLNK
jgi:thiol-disulfide isomerase/thioredoxin